MFNWDLTLQIGGLIVGLLYLWWEYNADRRLWIASVVMPAISLWLYFRKGLYADFAINIYYLAIAVYGYLAWTKHRRRPDCDNNSHSTSAEPTSLPIRHTPMPVAVGCVGATLILWLLIRWVLCSFTDSTVPTADAFTTALSIVAMWMLARKYIEQWLAWFVVDAVCVVLYIYKGIPLYALLYALYTIIALLGYRKWLKLMRK